MSWHKPKSMQEIFFQMRHVRVVRSVVDFHSVYPVIGHVVVVIASSRVQELTYVPGWVVFGPGLAVEHGIREQGHL